MKLVAFDIESTHLSGMFGRILCCCFKEILPNCKGEIITLRGDDPKYRNKHDISDDSKLVEAIRNKLEEYNIWIGHNSKLFDCKFINARLFKAGLRPLQARFHIDTMWIIRTHMRISSKLQNVQQFSGIPEEKTPINWDDWMRGMSFDPKAMSSIVTHCIQDVKVLEQAYWRLVPYIKTITK